MLTAGVLSALSILLVLSKLDIRRVLGYDVFVDFGTTIVLGWLFMGTYAGMVAAMVGGATISIILFYLKHRIGFKRLRWRSGRLKWVGYVPLEPMTLGRLLGKLRTHPPKL